MLKRELYLQKIRPVYDSPLIKIITGVRRCGKSVLLRQIIHEIQAMGVSDSQIIYMNFEELDYRQFLTADKLHQYLKSRITTAEKYYLFFDEIQEVRDFELVINSWRATHPVSIFITGSNSRLLSQELSTVLSGRYLSFSIYPFSFGEYVLFRRQLPECGFEQAFQEYLTWGGLPQIYDQPGAIPRRNYIQDLYNSIVLKDVSARWNIKNLAFLEKIFQYLLENLGKPISANSIVAYLKSEHLKISVDTVLAYIDYLDRAFLFHKTVRFDIRGKMVMRTLEKHYAADLAFLQLRGTHFDPHLSAKLENIVYQELLSRDHKVYIGKTKNGEVDFVAISPEGETTYYQVSDHISEENTRQRELAAFRLPRRLRRAQLLKSARNKCLASLIYLWN